MTAEIALRLASADDLTAVVRLWEEASRWLAARGSDQWQYPPGIERMAQTIASGRMWVAEDGTDLIGMITVDGVADPELWTPGDSPGDALYVHQAVVARSAAGKDVGSALFDWASRRAAAAGRQWLRLDAWAANADLHRYYAERGWTHLRTLNLPWRGSGALFQREAGSVTGRGPDVVEVART